MRTGKQTYDLSHVLAAVLMIITLLWLTISAPYVAAAEEQRDGYILANNVEDNLPDTEDSSPFGNTTEEKTESGSNTLSEYLHHIDELSHLASLSQGYNCSHSFAVYVAFHGELLCPPPDTLLS